MVQALLVDLIVLLAALWTFRSLAPRLWPRRRKPDRNAPAAGCGDNCGCGD